MRIKAQKQDNEDGYTCLKSDQDTDTAGTSKHAGAFGLEDVVSLISQTDGFWVTQANFSDWTIVIRLFPLIGLQAFPHLLLELK